MKKIFIMLTACIFSLGQVIAGNVLVVNDVSVPQGGQATLEIGGDFDTEYTAFELQIALPEGLKLVTDEDGYPIIEKAFDTNHILTGNLLPSNGNYKITCRSMDNLSIPTDGTLFRVTMQADASMAIGTTLQASIVACEFTRTADSNGENLADVEFAIQIIEFRTILDENATTSPEAAANADVLLKRTINAGEWSTICLPFTATGEQVKSAWGNDVQLANFTKWNSEEDDGAIVAINVNFTSASANDGIEANTPMLIKVNKTSTSATFDGVTLEPEETPTVQVGKKASERGYFYGTYAVMQVPEENLFLSGNKFWYSTGNTTIKGYRGYFEFRDVLDAYYDGEASVKVNIFIDDTETGIESLSNSPLKGENIYNLAGQRVNKAQKGIYIENGKKVLY